MTFTEAVRLAMEGEEAGYNELYQRTCQKSYYVALQYMKQEDEALDVMQDAYVKAFQNLDQLKEPEKFAGWFARIVATKALDELKKKKPILFSQMQSEETDLDFEEMIEDDRIDSQPELAIDQAETSRLVREMIDSLSDEQRLCIVMFYIEEMGVKEISQTLGVSENTVKSRLNYGRKNIKEKVLELEKRGTRLYNMAPLMFFVFLLMRDAQTVHAAPAGAGEVLMKKALSAKGGAVRPAVSGASAVGKTAGGLAAKKAVIALIATVSVGVATGGVVWFTSGRGNAAPEPVQEEIVVAEDPIMIEEDEEMSVPQVEEDPAGDNDLTDNENDVSDKNAPGQEEESQEENTEETVEEEEPWRDAYVQLAESMPSEYNGYALLEVQGSDYPIMVVLLDGYYDVFNTSLYEMFGFSSEEEYEQMLKDNNPRRDRPDGSCTYQGVALLELYRYNPLMKQAVRVTDAKGSGDGALIDGYMMDGFWITYLQDEKLLVADLDGSAAVEETYCLNGETGELNTVHRYEGDETADLNAAKVTPVFFHTVEEAAEHVSEAIPFALY